MFQSEEAAEGMAAFREKQPGAHRTSPTLGWLGHSPRAPWHGASGKQRPRWRMSGELLRVANCSGFYGDRWSAAAREMVEGGPIDVLTGDYLAELTMLILLKDKMRATPSSVTRAPS